MIPKEIRERHGWSAGTRLEVEDCGGHVVVRQAEQMPTTTLEDLAGCTGYQGPGHSLQDMVAAIARGARKSR